MFISVFNARLVFKYQNLGFFVSFAKYFDVDLRFSTEGALEIVIRS